MPSGDKIPSDRMLLEVCLLAGISDELLDLRMSAAINFSMAIFCDIKLNGIVFNRRNSRVMCLSKVAEKPRNHCSSHSHSMI